MDIAVWLRGLGLVAIWRCEAHELLAPVYGWFAEGFDTANVKEAKALLDELG